jgi:hypothetical protein
VSLTKNYDVTVWLDRVGQLGTFDTLTGGGVDSDELKYHPGGMAETISLGGVDEIDNVVVGRLYRLERDHVIVGSLLASPGKVGMIVVKQPLDPHGNVWGRPLIYIGTCKRCTPPEHDSNAGADAQIIELECTPSFVGVG